AAALQPQLVLLDVKLPDLSGYEVCRRLKADSLTSTIPVLLVSGIYGEGEDKVRGLESGADGYLVKPVQSAELIATIRALLRMRHAEERFRNLVDGLDAIVWEADTRTWRFTFVSQRAEKILGYPVERWLEEPDFRVGLIHPDDRERTVALGRSVTAEGGDHELEYRVIAADGRVRWVRDLVYVVPDAGGPARLLRGVMVDVTERKLAELSLQESEERFRLMADTAPVMIWISDADKLRTFFNQPWLDFTGRAMAEELGLGWAEGIHPDDYQRCLEIYLSSFASRRQFSLEYRLRRADGEYRWLLDSGIPRFSPDGSFAGYVGSCIDITERRQVEEERAQLLKREQAARRQAEESSRILQRLQSVTDIALTHLSFESLMQELPARIRELLGADSAAILLLNGDGQNLKVRAAAGLEEEVAAGLRIPIGQGLRGRVAETRMPLVVEDLSTEEVTSQPLREKFQSFIGAPLLIDNRVIGVIHANSVERRRFTEDDLRLLQLVADRVALAIEHTRLYEAEQQARHQAEVANRLKDDFLATVSHELRTPLNAIQGWVKLLREGRLNEEEAARALETVERSARAQNRIISDLLDVSRIIAGRLQLNLRPIEPALVIAAAVEAVRPAAEAKSIRLEKILDEGTGPISGDSDRLQQVVWNLLSNAIKFTPKGGRVEVRLEKRMKDEGGRRKAESEAPSEASFIEIIVSDTGAGISPEFLPFVFDRFRQGDSTTRRKQGGLGLGLAIVRHLAEMHGGTVRAESPGVGAGATFIVRLPLVQLRDAESGTPNDEIAALAEESAIDSPQSAILDGLRVLAVDDDPDARDLVRTILEQCGAEVKTAASAREALAFFTEDEEWQPEVLISDIEMPEADGYSLIRDVRALEARRGGRIPAVALTAYTRVEDRLRAL